MAHAIGSDGASGGGARYLITGAKGCIGAWIVKNLVERGDRPFIVDVDLDSERLAALLPDDCLECLTFIRGDVTRFEDLDQAVAGRGITHIIHLAALQVPACAANPPLGALVNVVGTLNVFEVARRRRDLVRRIVYASSAAVFGPEELYGRAALPEGAVLQPGTHYGVFKQCNEGNARVYYQAEGLSSAGVRPWAVYGVGRDQGLTSDPTKAIKASVLGRPFTLRFTGALDLQYVDDTARIFLRAVDSDLPGARLYNLHGSVVTTSDFIAALEKVAPGAARLVQAKGPHLPIASDLDDSALVKDLGPVPRTSLEEGIRQTATLFQQLQAEGRLDTHELEE